MKGNNQRRGEEKNIMYEKGLSLLVTLKVSMCVFASVDKNCFAVLVFSQFSFKLILLWYNNNNLMCVCLCSMQYYRVEYYLKIH